ncbi:MAG TPA: 4-hydroxybenzoate octaprenyltransferase [Mariprofundaceae bacterium]|nr:4-hydroxybenzoate octaprenyltransferase [Mariprofundaceae bacterium]
MIAQRLQAYGRLMRLDRPIGTYLVLWPTLWALWIAGRGHPDGLILLVFVLGTFLMRSAGCVINDFADRKVDPHVKRTKARPLATGEVGAREALLLFALLALTAFLLVLLMNRLTIMLACGGVVIAAIYPFMKRYTHWPQVFLGVAFAWGMPMAFAAQTGTVPAGLWILFAANFCWVMAYDTIYAMVDRDDDLKIGVKSTAILFGRFDRLVIVLFQVAFIALMAVAGHWFGLGILYDLGLLVAALLLLYHQYRIRRRERDPCFRAFLHNNYVGMAIFIAIVLDFAIQGV